MEGEKYALPATSGRQTGPSVFHLRVSKGTGVLSGAHAPKKGRVSFMKRAVCALIWRVAVVSVLGVLGLHPGVSPAQEVHIGVLEGRVVAERTGEPLPGVSVSVKDTKLGAFTDAQGRYRISGVPAGRRTLVIQCVGYEAQGREVVVRADAPVSVNFKLSEQAVRMPDVVVTATREGQSRAETPATVGILGREDIRRVRPTHPSELMRLVPGVWVSATGGEGHMTAIRHPLTTNPVYLYLEEGVPTRSTGFFNHNALYEINVPMASGVEVMKGPGTALYGSDAIGGIVNVTMRPAPAQPEFDLSTEGGAFGYARLLVTGGTTQGRNGIRADVNLTRTNGFREDTGYDRESGTLRWDMTAGDDTRLNTVVAFSRIHQYEAYTLSKSDYLDNPTLNYTPFALRQVRAFRVSFVYEKAFRQGLLSVTPFYRNNTMDLLPNWQLSYDPVTFATKHWSLGLMAKYRHDFGPGKTRVIAGLDVDRSPGGRLEYAIKPTKVGRVYTGYTLGAVTYDYGVTFLEASPYVQTETSPTDRLRLSAGLRADRLGYDYRNHLDVVTTGSKRRPASVDVRYNHLSPKLGATLAFSPQVNGFAAYSHAFRVPSEGQMFRQGAAVNTVGLKPIKADNIEAGLRAQAGRKWQAEVSVYSLTKTDDILTFTNPDGSRETLNAGKTLHRGVEVGMRAEPVGFLRLDASLSFARHTYDEWTPRAGLDYAGKRMEMAPEVLANARLAFAPAALKGADFSLEWVRLGRYFMNPDNKNEYPGHHLLNLTANCPLGRGWTVFGRLSNLTDRRYAESTSFSATEGELFAPGRPRALFGGLQYNWKK